MPLDKNSLGSQLASNFEAPAEDAPGCGQQWADAMKAYAGELVPPSTTVEDAAGTLAGALGAAFSTPAAIPLMEAAFLAFGAKVALGQAPTFTGTPPAGPVGFAALFTQTRESHAAAGADIADRIHTWMKTGTATLVALPNTVTPWS